jgi:hypothetical protein
LDAGQRGELLVAQCDVGVEVGGDDTQQLVGIAEQPLRLVNLGDRGEHECLESGQAEVR